MLTPKSENGDMKAPAKRPPQRGEAEKLPQSSSAGSQHEKEKKATTMTTRRVTLEDFEIRYQNIRKQYPKVKNCSMHGCKNPRDSTPLLGEDTCCAYHRLLFDFWCCDGMNPDKFYHYLQSQKGRRRAFTNWINKLGKAECDRLVLLLAQEGINWEC